MINIVDRLRDMADLFEAQQAPHNLVLHLRIGADEIDRLRAGGCARDQGLTQYCAEAARLAAENERLRERMEIDARHPYDGIYCRDETIRLQDNRITELKAEVERLRAALADLVRLVDQDDDYEADDVTPYHADIILDRARAALKEPRT